MTSHLTQNKSIYLKEKSELALEECLSRCKKSANDYTSISNRQLSCIQYCSIKFINAYSYAFDVIQNGGVYRLPESQLKRKTLK